MRKIMNKAAPKQIVNILQMSTQGQEKKPQHTKKHINKDDRCCSLPRGAVPKKRGGKHLDKDDSAVLLGALERLGV